MEPFNSELPNSGNFPTTISAFSTPMEVGPTSGVDDGGDQSFQMPPPAFAGRLLPQAAHVSAFGYHAGFEYSGLQVAEPNFQLSSNFASEIPPWNEDSYQPVKQNASLGANISLTPFLCPSQDQLASQHPRISSDISIPTVNTFSAPPHEDMLPSESRNISAPASSLATTTGKIRSLGTGAEWSRYKDTIRQLYIEENRSLKTTMEIMKEDHGFVSDINKFKHQLGLWGFEKNLKAKQSKYIKHVAKKRKLEGKKTEFRYKGAVVPQEKVDGLLKSKRKAVPSETCSPASKMSFGTPLSKPSSLPFRSPSLIQLDQPLVNAPIERPTKIWHEHDLEGLHDLHERANKEAEEGHHEQARIMFLETLEGYESLVGPCHHLTTQALSSFVQYCESRDLYDEAKDRMQKSLFNYQAEFGGNHQRTLESMARLGEFYYRQKRYGDGEVHLTTAKCGLEEIFSSDPEASFEATHKIQAHLTWIYKAQGDFERCEGELLSIVAKAEALSGTWRVYDILIYGCKDELCHLYKAIWENDKKFGLYPYRLPLLMKAEKLLLEIMEVAEKSPVVRFFELCAFEQLREQYHEFGEDEKLNVLLTRIEDKIGATSGAAKPTDPGYDREKLMKLELGVACSHTKLGNNEAAEWWHLRRLAQAELDEGPDSSEAIKTLVFTARLYINQDVWKDAEPLLRDAYRRAGHNPEYQAELSPYSLRERIANCLETRVWDEYGCICPHPEPLGEDRPESDINNLSEATGSNIAYNTLN